MKVPDDGGAEGFFTACGASRPDSPLPRGGEGSSICWREGSEIVVCSSPVTDARSRGPTRKFLEPEGKLEDGAGRS